ncbi:MAG: S-adenosylmethionine decarboxylase [bacterium]
MEIENKYISANIYSIHKWLDISEPSAVKELCLVCLEKSGYLAIGFLEQHFPNGGYTALWLLAESHLAVHTFPESQKTYLELSGCNEEKTKAFEGALDKL